MSHFSIISSLVKCSHHENLRRLHFLHDFYMILHFGSISSFCHHHHANLGGLAAEKEEGNVWQQLMEVLLHFFFSRYFTFSYGPTTQQRPLYIEDKYGDFYFSEIHTMKISNHIFLLILFIYICEKTECINVYCEQ